MITKNEVHFSGEYASKNVQSLTHTAETFTVHDKNL
jgi:hypothetical protein